MEAISILQQPAARRSSLLATGAPVYLPVNPQEYHGPHLSLANDALVSQGLIRELHGRLAEGHPEWPLLVVDDLGVGCGLVPGRGSRPRSYPEVRSAVLGACRALAEVGARRVVLMTFHGDPLHNSALQAGVDELTAHGVQAIAPTGLLLDDMMDLDESRYAGLFATVDDPEDRLAVREEFATDFHAGFAETSLALYYAPESVAPGYRDVPPCPRVPVVRALGRAARLVGLLGFEQLAREMTYGSRIIGWFDVDPFPGYTGRPHLANTAAGAFVAAEITRRYAEACEAVFDRGEPAPRPPLNWLARLSLQGRLIPVGH